MKHLNLLFAALNDLIRRRVRSIVVSSCITVTLLPIVTALAVSEGLKFQAEIAVNEGADIYLSADQQIGSGAISLGFLQALSSLEGVSGASARVVGRTYFADRVVAIVGLEKKSLLSLSPLIKGKLPVEPGDVIVGRGIARDFSVEPGLRFTLTANNKKVFRSVGTLSDTCLWGSDILVMDIDDANEFFRMKGEATQILVYASGIERGPVKRSMEGLLKTGNKGFMGIQMEERKRIDSRLKRGYGHREGIFIVLLTIGFSLAISAFLITSGFGMKEMTREIGLMKAVGWRTMEVLEKITLENLVISASAVSLSILISMFWMKVLNGFLIGQFYVAEVGMIPHVDIPSRYLPSHALFSLLFALIVTMTGSLFSAWRKATTPPMELMR